MSRSSRPVPIAATGALLAAALLGACGQQSGGATAASAVGSPQTCYRLPTGDTNKAVVLSGGDGDLMTCAMHVEAFRLMRRAGSAMGYYQGHYVFASADGGITAAETLQAPRFHVYTPGQQADIDAKVNILIARQKAADADAGAPANAAANAQD